MSKIRLQKILADAGIASRRASEELITAGRVEVNGKIVQTPGSKADPNRDIISVDGERIPAPSPNEYFLLHKPMGVVSTSSDPQGRPTVMDYLPKTKARIYPVGRLDMDSEGLVFLTNDGDMTLIFTHPRYEVKKRYLVEVTNHPTPATIKRLKQGVRLDDGTTAPAKVKLIKSLANSALLEFEIHEGKNRQIRRMCAALGHQVLSLKRFQMGPLTLADLALGECRKLKPSEALELHEFVRKVKQGQ